MALILLDLPGSKRMSVWLYGNNKIHTLFSSSNPLLSQPFKTFNNIIKNIRQVQNDQTKRSIPFPPEGLQEVLAVG